ncbi:FAD-dependent monooxygenase [Streptomyces sp. NPDC048473]|uniref:FAD-dependent monooxygenase n=1 Tax=unclassified Streptomyces TaxID=2593676 RepID=UPI00371D4A20
MSRNVNLSAPTTVLIVGAGPSGLAAAAELALHNIDCVIVEPRPTVSHRRPRAKTTTVRTMEHLRRWGVAEQVRKTAPLPVAWSQRVTFCDALSGHRITDFDGVFGLIAWKIAAVAHGWAGQALLASYETERRSVVEQTVATAESNMRSLVGDLAADATAIQTAKHAEFHSLGLVLGYSYAGSPVIQPTGATTARGDSTSCTPSIEPGARLPHAWLTDGSSLYDHLGP